MPDTVTDLISGFCEAMFFCDTSCYHSSDFFGIEEQEAVIEGRADGSLPADADSSDLDAESLKCIHDFCEAFARDHAELLAEALELTDAEAIGRDLYYTRAGHGVGFTDRDELMGDGEALEEARAALRHASQHGTIAEWGKARMRVNELEAGNLANRLTKAAGRGEVSTTAYEDENAPSGFYVEVYLG